MQSPQKVGRFAYLVLAHPNFLEGVIEYTSLCLIYWVNRSFIIQVFLDKNGGQLVYNLVGGRLDGHFTNTLTMRGGLPVSLYRQASRRGTRVRKEARNSLCTTTRGTQNLPSLPEAISATNFSVQSPSALVFLISPRCLLCIRSWHGTVERHNTEDEYKSVRKELAIP